MSISSKIENENLEDHYLKVDKIRDIKYIKAITINHHPVAVEFPLDKDSIDGDKFRLQGETRWDVKSINPTTRRLVNSSSDYLPFTRLEYHFGNAFSSPLQDILYSITMEMIGEKRNRYESYSNGRWSRTNIKAVKINDDGNDIQLGHVYNLEGCTRRNKKVS